MNAFWLCLLGLVAAASAAQRPKRQYTYYPRYAAPQVAPIGYPSVAYSGAAPHAPGPAPPALPTSAVCVLKMANNDSKVYGEIVLHQATAPGVVQVTGTVVGLTPGRHGFHIHQNPNTTDECKDAGPHFNPSDSHHGAPDDKVRHAGDLGNIEAGPDGVARFSIADTEISLVHGNPRLVVGRSIVVHAAEDDLGRGNNEDSKSTGNAGGRLACCVIEQPLYYRK